MRIVPMNEDEFRAECDSALEDAQKRAKTLTADRVRFYPLAALDTSHVGASWFRPHGEIEPDCREFPDEAQRVVANLPENLDKHRIAVPASPTDRPTFAALVRHELEHAVQWEAGVGIIDFHDVILHRVLGEIADRLDGCEGALVNSMPTEADCNAAASVYIARRFSDAEVQLVRCRRSNLACSLIEPAPPETLPARMIAFAFVHRAAVEHLAERKGCTVESILSLMHPKAPKLWRELEQGL